MSAFDDGKKIEERGKQRLAKWLDGVAYEGRWVWNAKGALQELIQRQYDVDVMIGIEKFESTGLECKFLENARDAPFELWSNLVEFSEGVPDHEKCTRGWGLTSQADLILIYDQARDAGVVGRLLAWRVMLNEKLENGNRRWKQYDKRVQNKREQANRTVIIWTPYDDLVRHAGFAKFSARQLELFDQGNPIQVALFDERCHA